MFIKFDRNIIKKWWLESIIWDSILLIKIIVLLYVLVFVKLCEIVVFVLYRYNVRIELFIRGCNYVISLYISGLLFKGK